MINISERDLHKVNDIIAALDYASKRRDGECFFASQRAAIDAYYRMQSEAHIMNRAFDAEHAEDIAVVMAAHTGADVEYCQKLLDACESNYAEALKRFSAKINHLHMDALTRNRRLDNDILDVNDDLSGWPYERVEQDRAAIIRYITYLNTGSIPK